MNPRREPPVKHPSPALAGALSLLVVIAMLSWLVMLIGSWHAVPPVAGDLDLVHARPYDQKWSSQRADASQLMTWILNVMLVTPLRNFRGPSLISKFSVPLLLTIRLMPAIDEGNSSSSTITS
jgi:hypothetical protein